MRVVSLVMRSAAERPLSVLTAVTAGAAITVSMVIAWLSGRGYVTPDDVKARIRREIGDHA